MFRRLLGILVMPLVAIVALIPVPKSVFYKNRRPTRAGRMINRAWTWMAGAGLTPNSWPGQPRGGTIALETTGRRSGRARANVVTWVEHDGERYLVSMLGEAVDWVRNARAANGEAAIRHGDRHPVRLVEVPVDQRAPIIQAYLKRTRISTQEHLGGIAVDAPLEEFQRIAPRHPVFRIVETS
jgi:deazaflavin-dependent oxidoreductase (nitroreductase family)